MITKEEIKDWWVNKRYRKKKKIDINESIENYAVRYIPLYVVDGDEDKTGDGEIEINFDHVKKENDIMLSLTPCERERVDTWRGSAVFWYDRDELKKQESFYIYYGCKNRWARLLDRFFIEETGYGDDVAAVWHLNEPITDSL